jgi:hypothetical protein
LTLTMPLISTLSTFPTRLVIGSPACVDTFSEWIQAKRAGGQRTLAAAVVNLPGDLLQFPPGLDRLIGIEPRLAQAARLVISTGRDSPSGKPWIRPLASSTASAIWG